MKLNSKIKSKIKKIKLVVTDVDGVLTDGGMYYSEKGEILKKFNTRDGMAVELLLEKGLKTVFVTKESTKIASKRAKKVHAALSLSGIKNKESILSKLNKKFRIRNDEIAYIGDDINDINIMKKIGFSAAPIDANQIVKRIADHVCKTKGGNGVLREVADLIIEIQFLDDRVKLNQVYK